MEQIIIVGAGVMGCACGYLLAQSGFKVTLLERALPGAESSAAAAGILGAQSEVSTTGPFLDLCLASRALFAAYARELEELTNVSVGYERSGVLEVALDPAEGRLVAARAQWMLDQGLRVELLDREQARHLEPALTPHLVGANYYPDDHQVDPVALSRAQAAAASRVGCRFKSGVQVTGLIVAGERVNGVTTDNGPLAADGVIIAGGAWSTRLHALPPLRTQAMPMAGQIVQLETRPPFFRHILYGVTGYVVPRADGRVLLGSTLEDRGFDKAVTAGGIHRITGMGLDMVPELTSARLMNSWAGLRPATKDGLPLLGAGPLKGLFFATGHFRNGILLTPITAHIIRNLVMGRPPPLNIQPFAP